MATFAFTLRARLALGDICLHFAWPAWHLWHWAGSGGALGGVAGVALGDTCLHFVWQVWRLTSTSILCVAGVALMPLGWLWWRAWFPVARTVTWRHLATPTCILRGRRGAWRHRPSLCVVGVALGDSDVHSAWQAWHLWHWTGSGGACSHLI